MAKKVLVIVAEGYEDMEAVAPIDVLTRVGIEITVAGLQAGTIKASYGTTMQPHVNIEEVNVHYDGIALPGGLPNAELLAAHPKVVALVKEHHEARRLVAAICASPALVLAEAAGILKGRKCTGVPLPDYDQKIRAGGAVVTGEPVTIDDHLITGMGPGAALPWALALAEYLAGKEAADDLRQRWRLTS